MQGKQARPRAARGSTERPAEAGGRAPSEAAHLRMGSSSEQPALRIMDSSVLVLFLLYAVHVVIAPLDSQYAAEQRVMEAMEYGQLINGSYGQVFFALYLAARAALMPDIYKSMLNGLGLLAVWAALSTAWSVEPLTTLHRAADLFLCVMMPAAMVRALGFEQCLRLTWITLSAILVLSVLTALSGSEYGLMQGFHLGLWRGLFDHKNAFAPFAATVAVFSFMAPPAITGPRWRALSMAALAATAVGFAGSATSYVAIIAAGIIMGQIRLCRRLNFSSSVTTIVMLSSLALGIAIGLGVAAMLIDVLGRDMSLTGRTRLWNAALPYTLTAPFGYGYGLGGGEQLLAAVRLASRWYIAPSLHSGYITLAIDLGWPAVVAFVAFLVSKILILVWRTQAEDPYLLMAAGFAAMHLSLAITESTFGPYLNAPLLLIIMVSHARRRFQQRSLFGSGLIRTEGAKRSGNAGR